MTDRLRLAGHRPAPTGARRSAAAGPPGHSLSATWIRAARDRQPTRTPRPGGRWAARRALSSSPPALNTWTALVGVFDGATDKLSLYVNGQLQGTATDPTPWASHGDLVFGRSLNGRSQGTWFPGLISDVKIFTTALTAAQVKAL